MTGCREPQLLQLLQSIVCVVCCCASIAYYCIMSIVTSSYAWVGDPRHLLTGSVFSRTIKLMLERQKSSIYQHEMLLECAKITPYQQDMSH